AAAAAAGPRRRGGRGRAGAGAGSLLAAAAGRQQHADLPADGADPVAGTLGGRAVDAAPGRTGLAGPRRSVGWAGGSALRRHSLCLPLLRRLAAVRGHLVLAGDARHGRGRGAPGPPPAALVTL